MINLSRLFTKTEYTVGYRFSRNGLLEDTETPFEFIKLSNKNYWYADPFIYKHNGETYVFMEIFQYDKGYAGLGYSVLREGKLTEPKLVIDTGYHMSFPLIFDYNGRIFMVPETCAVNQIQIFECTAFPDRWIRVGCVKEKVNYYDSVIFENDGRFYMFTSAPTDDMYGSCLMLAELEKDGEFLKAVRQADITADYKISRQAGKMLMHNGKLVRVAQDCANSDYGHALEFLETENLSLDNYSEKHIKEITVSDLKISGSLRGASGIHTYNREDGFEVVDFKLCTFSLKSTFLKIKIVFGMITDKIKRRK